MLKNRDYSQMLIGRCTDFITIPKFVYLKPCIEKKKKQSIIKVMWTKVHDSVADSPIIFKLWEYCAFG